MGKPFGIPKTGVFGLIDLVGLDLMPHINASLAAATAAEGPIPTFHLPRRPADQAQDDREGYTGRKGKGGFYRINRDKAARQGGDRPEDRRLPPGAAQAGAAELANRQAARRSCWPRPTSGGALCLARAGPDARLCRRAGAEIADDIAHR
jgi:3-hydroxyacyl-CoA dehydrogenase